VLGFLPLALSHAGAYCADCISRRNRTREDGPIATLEARRRVA
jgi:hypothetical protein